LKKKQILKSLISIGSYQSFIDHIITLSNTKTSSYVCVANVHMLIEGYQDPHFQHVINQADIATPDGMPLAKAMKWLYGIEQERVAGMDLMPDLMKTSEEKALSIFLYGSTDEILHTIETKAKKEFPNLIICGTFSPPFRELSTDEKNNIITMINERNPTFVFVALGCPKQEKWMAEHKGKVNSCMIGLGGAFEVYAGVKNRAPLWMQKISLEWLYRLIQDPKRLWRRYLYTNSLFVYALLKQLIYTKCLNRRRGTQ
jgi:N-acetylglucosaminyldiphosphoundecaprenol N-acetyl-beta-D-mannosaminyltransferase